MAIISEAGCGDGWSSDESEVNGECEECGGKTVDGRAASGCCYSTVMLTTKCGANLRIPMNIESICITFLTSKNNAMPMHRLL